MMKVCMRKYSVNPTTDRAEFCYRRFFDADSEIQFYTRKFLYRFIYDKNITCYEWDMKEIPAGKIFVAVK